MKHREPYITTEADNGLRLDAFIASRLACGLREAKRRAETGRVLVNGRIRPPHFKLRPGTTVLISADEAGPCSPWEHEIRIVTAREHFTVFYKPAGLHTAHIAAGREPSLEHAVATGWPTLRQAWLSKAPHPPAPIPPAFLAALGGDGGATPPEVRMIPENPPLLVTRLDAGTSGLVTAAFTKEGERRFRDMEAAGAVDKYYLAATEGLPDGPLLLRNALDTDSRVKTRVLPTENSDATRFTEVTPLGPASVPLPWLPGHIGLVAARIQRGARHQIRAHLAHAGFPLYGDALYGAGDGRFFLHHARIRMPGLAAWVPPPWNVCFPC